MSPTTTSASRDLPAPARLFLTSATLLFAELLLIRWIPENVVYVGFFNNLILIASFLGIGLGILLGQGGRTPRWPVAHLLLFALAVVVHLGQTNSFVTSDRALFLGAPEHAEIGINVLALAAYFTLTAAFMAALALPLGPLLRALPPLRAYAVDIAGALGGIAAFAALSALATPPFAWFTILGALLLALRGRHPITARAALGGLAMTAVAALAFLSYATGDESSPYYRINLYRDASGTEEVFVNGIGHQTLAAASSPSKAPFYEQVYEWLPNKKFERALIIGAGGGTDVAVALTHGVTRVDAVDIDPALLQLGVDRHPDRPYDSPAVHRYVNDGRAFLRSSADRYDLIVLALTDSLTLVTATANLRLESFLFTAEAFADARDHLAPDGVFILYNYYREDWVIGRYARTIRETFGASPLIRTFPQSAGRGAVLAAGDPAFRLARARDGDREHVDLAAAPRPARDDWPFPYLERPGISPQYLIALGLILLFAALAVAGAVRRSGVPGAFSPHFFALGAAFLLLETRSLAAFSLLFGTTWYVNALVFAGILISVLLAIAVNARFRFPGARSLYASLAFTLVVAYLVPPQSLLIEPAWLRYVAASVIMFAPVFAANLVFVYSFRNAARTDTAFASNVIGATLGGALEYTALITGYQQLLLLVGALYLIALVFATRFRVLADTGLAGRGA